MNLTKKEKTTLKAIASNALYQMGGTDPKDLHEDNFSWFFPKDIVKRTPFSKAQVSGLISVLAEKKLIQYEKRNEWFLTEDGINKAHTIWYDML